MNVVIGYGISVFIGIIAGILVNIGVEEYRRKRGLKQNIRNLIFEIDINILKIDKWLELLQDYRNAVNGDNILNFFGYFDFSKSIFSTANFLFASGLLYGNLSHENIGKLQETTNRLSIGGENYINNQVSQRKLEINNPHLDYLLFKQNVNNDISFEEKQLKECKANFITIKSALKEH